MSDDYKPQSVNAVLSRMETKLDSALKRQDEQDATIRRIWAALNRIDVKVASIAAVVSIVLAVGKAWIFKS